MQGPTKKELQVFIPILCATTLNLIAVLADMSGYMQGLLQGMAIMLLVMSCIYMFPSRKGNAKPSKSTEHGNN